MVISSAKFGENSLNGLKEKLVPSIFQEIVSDCEFKESALLKLFKSLEDHKAYYYYFSTHKKNYLIVASFGEIQPTRFQFFLEGVWSSNKTILSKK